MTGWSSRVWTNGSMQPDDAVKESAKILARHIDLFVHLGEKAESSAWKWNARKRRRRRRWK